MSTYRLDKLFAPRSVALVGASHREGSLGRIILRNLREGGFPRCHSPRQPALCRQSTEPLASPRIEDLPETPDLVVITAPPPIVPGIVAAAGAKGVPAAIIITAGLGHGPAALADGVRLQARKHGLRLVGPDCLGVLAPRAKLNASYAAHSAAPGDLALISQSSTIAAGLVEWAAKRRVGFSGVVSLGEQIDVDVSDCLDYFALDSGTRAILLYIEAITTPASSCRRRAQQRASSRWW